MVANNVEIVCQGMDAQNTRGSNDQVSSNHPELELANKYDDWEYAMRREMQEIIPGLFLGPYAAAMRSKLESLQTAGITHILCVRQNAEANFIKTNFPEHFRYLVLNIADLPTENIISHFKQSNEFIDDCLKNGGKVLVHGNGGLSRSAALVIAFIMEKFLITLNQALTCVRNRRFCVSLNDGFMKQLLEYEHICQAQAAISGSEPDGWQQNVMKRKRDDNDSDGSPSPKVTAVDFS